jgi:outer membrane immunogenic protein
VHLDGAEGLDITSDINLLGSLRARLGYAEDRTLFYVTGGLAFADTRHAWNDGGSEDFNMPSKSVDLNFGWVVGAGIEHAWTDNWLVRLEGFYYDLGSKDRTVSDEDETDEFEVKQDIWVGRVGISYKFD